MGLSLTRKQVESAPGAELLHLLNDGAEAGWVSDDQIRKLHQWLHANSASALPAVPFLTKLTDEVLSKGKVTREGRHTLRLAVERVLPANFRDLVKLRRRTLEGDERAKARDAKLADQESAREYARLNRPRSFNFMVAGTAYEDRPDAIRAHVREEQRVFLFREPHNPHDSNAIAVSSGDGDYSPSPEQETYAFQGYEIGYVPRAEAAAMAPLLDAGYKQVAVCTKILRNSPRGPIPIVEVSLYHPEGNAPPEALILSVQQHTDQMHDRSERRGPLLPGWLIVLLLVIFAFIVLANKR